MDIFPWRVRKEKNLLDHVAENCAGQMQSYSSKCVRHYDYNDCAKYHFHNWLRSNWEIWWLEFFPLEMLKKKSVEALNRGQYRANAELSFEMGSTLSLQWLCKIPLSQLTSFQLRNLIAGVFPLETYKKKSVGPRSRGQCRANAELSFEMGSTLSLQGLCKIPLSQLTSFQLRDLMTGSFPLETHKKKSVEARSRGQCRANAELSFEIGSTLSLQWLWKIPLSQLTSFQLRDLMTGSFPLDTNKK